MKICSKCKQEKDESLFFVRKERPSGRSSSCKECQRVLYKKVRTPDQYRETRLLTRFGITISDYNSMLQNQNGVCAICEQVCSSGRRLAVDHCHDTGKIRGLLCTKCNQGIGSLRHDPSLLLSAVEYLHG